MLVVKILLAILILAIISGCCEPKIEYKYINVPVKCKVPDIGNIEDRLDHKDYNTTNSIIARILHNSDTKSQYIEELLEAQKLCK